MNAEAETEKPFYAIVRIAMEPNNRLALMVMFTLMFAQFFIVPFISPFMVANAGLSESDLPLIYLFGGLATMFVLPLTGRLADKHGRHRLFSVFSYASLVVILVMTHLPMVPVPIALTVTTCFFIAVSSRGVAATTMITAAVQPAERGRFMSLNAAVQQMSAGLASWLAGFVIVKSAEGRILHYDWLGWMAVGSGLICLALAKKVKERS